MRAVVQRISEASVQVDGREIGRIGEGLLVYLGVGKRDTDKDLEYIVSKTVGLRIFKDEGGAMNRSVLDVGGEVLIVSQFTLHGDVRRGKRPSFTDAMEPNIAEGIYESFIHRLEALGVRCSCGAFGAMMDVSSINDGPVTILLDSTKLF